jgi:hypothetical protein
MAVNQKRKGWPWTKSLPTKPPARVRASRSLDDLRSCPSRRRYGRLAPSDSALKHHPSGIPSSQLFSLSDRSLSGTTIYGLIDLRVPGDFSITTSLRCQRQPLALSPSGTTARIEPPATGFSGPCIRSTSARCGAFPSNSSSRSAGSLSQFSL